MDLSWIWKSLIILVIGIFLIRMSGRRSIAQMTFPQTVIMLSLGAILVVPISSKNIWITLGTTAILIISLIFLEYIELKSDFLEGIITGKSNIIIENGALNQGMLRKIRMTVDKLEMRLRQKGIEKISDVKWATIEPSGELGYVLTDDKKTATKEDIHKLMREIEQLSLQIGNIANKQSVLAFEQSNKETNLFTEIELEKNIPEPPKHLQ